MCWWVLTIAEPHIYSRYNFMHPAEDDDDDDDVSFGKQ
jgi:hypothetical protein